MVGGYVELIPMPGAKFQLYVDEDGLSKGLKFNLAASMLARRDIVGNALILCGKAVWK